MRDPILATCLSILMVGMGQVYNREYTKGILMWIGAIITSLITFGIGGIAFWIWSVIDAYKVAIKDGGKV